MPLFKAKRDLALVAIAVVLVLCLSVTPREAAITYEELEDENGLSDRHDDRAGYVQYRAGERVASDVFVSWDRGLVPETEITSHVPGSLFQSCSEPIPLTCWLPGFTVIRSLLVANGTFFVVADRLNRLPALQFMLSAWNDTSGKRPSSTSPSQEEIRVVSRKVAGQLIGTSASLVGGTTWIYNEPYVCMCFGSADALKAHSRLIDVDGSWPLAFLRAHYMQDRRSTNNAILLPPRRLLFLQIHSEKIWHNPDLWSLPHILFPCLGVLYSEDWKDYTDSRGPFLLEHVVLVDRGAAARNPRIQSTSGDVAWAGGIIDDKTEMSNLQLGTPFDSFRDVGGLWWGRWRQLLAVNANMEANIEDTQARKTVITLVQDHSGQRGRLQPDSDTKLRAELVTMKLEEGYEVNYVKWNETSFLDRLDLALRTTVRQVI